jgi:hypothetical protein
MRRWVLGGPPDWTAARDTVVPLLARRSGPAALGRAVAVSLDPGIRVGFGVDLGPMFLHVTDDVLRGWGIAVDELTRRAIGNLRSRSRHLRRNAATNGRIGMTRLAALQSPEGWASSLLLAPDLLPRWFGDGPRVYIAPSRNMIVALPSTTDARLAVWLRDEIAAQLPDALDVAPLRWDDGTLTRMAGRETPRFASPRIPCRPQGDRAPRWRRGQGAATWYTTPPNRSVT